MTVLIVGNSVSMPPAPDVPGYPERLAAMTAGRWSMETLIKSGETIEQMERDVLAAIARRPDRVVIQVGINECAPRPLSVAERERLGQAASALAALADHSRPAPLPAADHSRTHAASVHAVAAIRRKRAQSSGGGCLGRAAQRSSCRSPR